MRKIFALFINEMIKLFKKTSVIVILALMIVGIIGIGGLVKLQGKVASSNDFANSNLQWQKDNLKQELATHETAVSDLKKKKASAKEEEIAGIESQIRIEQSQVDMLQYANDKDILPFTSSYRAQAIQKLFQYKLTISNLSIVPADKLSDDQQKELQNAGEYIMRLQKVVENKDFKEFISILNDEISNNTALSDKEKKIYQESNQLKLKNNITGETNGNPNLSDNLMNVVYKIENSKRSLLNDIDYSNNNKPLTPELRKKLIDSIAISEYKLNHGLISNNSSMGGIDVKALALSGIFGAGTFMVVLLMIILAGGSISQEISTGSIKSLIIAPVKRWKIFVAKVAALLVMGILCTLLAYIAGLISYGIFFGFSSGSPYIYAVNGTAHELSFYLYQLAKLFTDFFTVTLFIAFALMLSVVTRNTAVSVGISIGVFFAGSIVNQFLLQIAKGEWMKFNPFNNMNLSTRVFSFDTLIEGANRAMGSQNLNANPSVAFSLCYILVLMLCMSYTALDSFKRRDIR